MTEQEKDQQDPQDQHQNESMETEAASQEPQDESANVDISDLATQLETLTNALADSKDQVLRAQAEAHNARRRAEQDVEKAHKFGQEKLLLELLPVMDNLERALGSIDVEDPVFKPVVEGIELTLKSFVDTLQRFQVEQVNPEGEPFDPQSHQAMTMVDNPDVEPNTVLTVFQKGYTLHGRLIRPAMVVVSK